MVSRSGVVLLRELADESGLTAGWTEALLDTYRAAPVVHAPGAVLRDLAVTIAMAVTRWRTWRRCAIKASCSERWPVTRPHGGSSSAWTPSI